MERMSLATKVPAILTALSKVMKLGKDNYDADKTCRIKCHPSLRDSGYEPAPGPPKLPKGHSFAGSRVGFYPGPDGWGGILTQLYWQGRFCKH